MAEVSARPDVSILVVAYNSRSVIERCLACIEEATRNCEAQVLFIDNGSDGTQEFVSARFPDTMIIPSRGNIGFAAANNLLASHASADRLLLINPDLFVEEQAIEALLDGSARYFDAGAWGGITLDSEGRPDAGNAIPYPSLRELLSAALGRSRAGRAKPDVTSDCDVRVLCGGFVMISRPAWESVGGFDPGFFLYGEDVDLFHRLREEGLAAKRLAAARAVHLTAHGENLSEKRLLFKVAGTMQFLRKHRSRPVQSLGAGLLWLAASQRWIAGRLFGRWKPEWAAIGNGHRSVALQPLLWKDGYDPATGLIARLDVPSDRKLAK